MTTRADRSSHENRPTIQASHPGKPDRFFSSEAFHRSVLIVRSVARFGSALTASSALMISASSGAARDTRNWDGCRAATLATDTPRVRRTTTGTARITSSTPERTPELLLDVPRFELGASREIHREAGGHIERLEKQHRGRVGAGHDQGKLFQALSGNHLHDVGDLPLGRKPEQQRRERYQEGGLAREERLSHQKRGTGAAPPDLPHACTCSEERASFELIHRLRQRSRERESLHGTCPQQLPPPHLPLRAPEVSDRRGLPEGRAREHEKNRAIEPRLTPP